MDTPTPTVDLAQPDLGWLGLARHRDDDRWSFELTSGLARHDNRFFGGTGIAIATALCEARTSRPALWATAQFVGSASIGDRVDCHVEVLAHGRRSSQLRITGSVGGDVLFAALGSTGSPSSRMHLEAQIPPMPEVPGPEETPPFEFGPPPGVTAAMQRTGWTQMAELRSVPGLGRRMALWVRMREMPLTRAALGFLGDMVPVGVVRAAGRAGAGTSLDNSMRFGPAPASNWALVELDPWMASGGYVHGAARMWSEDGVLLAVATQTASALLFD